MIKYKFNGSKWTPAAWAILFSLCDMVAIVFLQISNYLLSTSSVAKGGLLGHIEEFVMVLWGKLHLPIRSLLEPLYFPAIVTHPSQISEASIFAFQLSCILQFTLIGYVLGFLFVKLRR